MIQELCNKLNEDIHNPLYYNFYAASNESRYYQTFTSLDLIEDCQLAIEEFESTEVKGVEGRTTLYIYGVLQALFCQQDGLFHLYKCTVNTETNGINSLFSEFDFSKEIREVRNDIAGHPTNRKKSEYYFISKGLNSKYKFTYAGYTPDFRKVEVDLKSYLSQQEKFAIQVLKKIERHINMKINEVKSDNNKVKLIDVFKAIETNRCVEMISRGIRDQERNFQGEWGIKHSKDTIEKIKTELNKKYNNLLPDSLNEQLKTIEYILKEV